MSLHCRNIRPSYEEDLFFFEPGGGAGGGTGSGILLFFEFFCSTDGPASAGRGGGGLPSKTSFSRVAWDICEIFCFFHPFCKLLFSLNTFFRGIFDGFKPVTPG